MTKTHVFGRSNPNISNKIHFFLSGRSYDGSPGYFVSCDMVTDDDNNVIANITIYMYVHYRYIPQT